MGPDEDDQVDARGKKDSQALKFNEGSLITIRLVPPPP